MKLVALFDAPAPYTTPVLNALARRLELHAVYLSDADRVTSFDDSWGTTPEFGRSIHWKKAIDVPSVDLHVEFSVGVSKLLRRQEADALMVVSWKPTVLEPLVWSAFSGTAAVMWSESTSFSGLLRDPLTTSLRRAATRAVDSFVTNGSQATAYLEQLGVEPWRIVTSRLPAASAERSTERAGTTDELRFLFVGRLVARKRPLELIEAFAAARPALQTATLTVVGGGELEDQVRAAAARTPGVEYAGYREGAELDAFYASSDVLVVPSLREVWGIVVNEALAHGLFVVATDEVGSAHDLLGRDAGVMLPAHALERLAPTLVEVGRTVDRSDAARRRRAELVAGCTPESFAADIERAARLAVQAQGRRPRR